jgi:hypothetical protein
LCFSNSAVLIEEEQAAESLESATLR